MVKPLTFKGDKKSKKRKRDPDPRPDQPGGSSSTAAAAADGPRPQRADDEAANDDSWVSAEAVTDVSGPVMVVLPTERPSALACDASGKVFPLPVENIVDGNPSSAEPHDVRQVWVASKVAGTESFRFKGHHGRYLGCDKFGILSASSEAVSPQESFTVIRTPETPGTFQLQTARETFVTVKEAPSTRPGAAAEVRGDADSVAFGTTFRIRMQARFKPRLKLSKEEKAREKISRKELEEAVGRRLDEDEVKTLKRARREGDYHEQLLTFKMRTKHDKFG